MEENIEKTEQLEKTSETTPKRFNRGWIFAIILAIMFVTNPSESKHHAKVMQEFVQDRGADEFSGDAYSNAGSALGMSLANTIIEKAVQVDNFLLFSTGTLHWDGETRLVTIGAFGNVFFIANI